jgi:hypothetical protein
MRGALQNCGIEVIFRLERPDAEYSVDRSGFPYHPYLPKYRPTSPFRWSSPTYYSRAEQRAFYVDAITALEPREAFLKLPHGDLYALRALTVDDPPIDARLLRDVEARYLTRYFRPQSEIEAEIATMLAPVTPGRDVSGLASPLPAPVVPIRSTPSATMNGYDPHPIDDTDDEYTPEPV